MTATNSDSVARTGALSVTTLGGAGAGSVGAIASGEGGANPAGLNGSLGSAALLRRAVLMAWTAADGSARPDQRALATTDQRIAASSTQTQACSLGGTITATVDDRDGNGTLSAGDVIALSFSQCIEAGPVTFNGSTSLSISAVSSSGFSGRISASALSAAQDGYSVALTGAFTFDYAAAVSTAQTLRLTADGDVSASVQSASLTDTLTLLSGYVETEVYNASAVPPEGGTAGQTTVTINGRVRSTSLGGIFTLTTPTSLVAYDVDTYARSGVMLVTGRNSALRMTVQSNTSVLIELDADGNGSYESSATQAWTWLL